MSKYQKAAALTLRLVSFGLCISAILHAAMMLIVMPGAFWLSIPVFLLGVILFIYAIPLAKILAGDIQD